MENRDKRRKRVPPQLPQIIILLAAASQIPRRDPRQTTNLERPHGLLHHTTSDLNTRAEDGSVTESTGNNFISREEVMEFEDSDDSLKDPNYELTQESSNDSDTSNVKTENKKRAEQKKNQTRKADNYGKLYYKTSFDEKEFTAINLIRSGRRATFPEEMPNWRSDANAESRFVITVAPQNDICPHGSTYPRNAVPITVNRIITPTDHVSWYINDP
ncbi:hypothetical protein ILUMI_12192 [Ignelater luminosus]|uniref:Uncharacterized protein n=1 Tax=Ignelater luminosus TaxID=2038154 RepID=A0A8K0CYX9_IGNLU|nr:hypothetical protein ILUMI_12192 [Ignelater luminosus]